MKQMLLGISILLFAIAFALASTGMGIFVFLISLAGLAITIQGYRK